MQNTNLMDLDAAFASSARTALKDAAPGTSIEGEILRHETRQATEYGTGMPAVFANSGQPKIQLMVVIQTSDRDPLDPNDSGERSVWIKAWGSQRKALNAAIRQSGCQTVTEALTPGNRLKVTYHGETRQSNGKNSWQEKTYSYELTRGSVAAVEAAFAQPAQTVAPATPAAPAAPATAPAAPAAAPAAPAQQDAAPQASLDRATKLIGLGLGDSEIAGATGITIEQVAALRGAEPPF